MALNESTNISLRGYMHCNQIKEALCILKQCVASHRSRNLELCLKISACNLVHKFLSERPSFCYVGAYVSDYAAHVPETLSPDVI
jgi:hypothetical protein